jgi:hypothetical protein
MLITSTKHAAEILKAAGVKPAVMNSEELADAAKERNAKKPLVKNNKDAEAVLAKNGVSMPFSDEGLQNAVEENAKEVEPIEVIEEKEVENKAEIKATKSK